MKAVIASGVISVALVATFGPQIGLFVWTANVGRPGAAAPASESTATVTPDWPEWARRSITRIEGEIVHLEEALKKARMEAARYRGGLKHAKAEEARLKRQEEARERRARMTPPPPPRNVKRSLAVSACSVSAEYGGTMTFRFAVANPNNSWADTTASIYLVEIDYLLGPELSLVAKVPLELAPRQTLSFTQSWTITDGDDRLVECRVQLKPR